MFIQVRLFSIPWLVILMNFLNEIELVNWLISGGVSLLNSNLIVPLISCDVTNSRVVFTSFKASISVILLAVVFTKLFSYVFIVVMNHVFSVSLVLPARSVAKIVTSYLP